jgi:DnaJ-domain-containing protein 1
MIDWPAGFERTPADERGPKRQFDTSLSEAFDHLETHLRRSDIEDYRYSFDAQSRKADDRPYSRANPDDPGFVLRWTKDGGQFAIACDAHSRLRDNVHEVGKYVAEKGRMSRRPATTGRSEFANARLPSGDDETVVASAPPHDVLEVSPDADPSVVEAAYRAKIKEVHPDNGGDRDEFQRVKRAKEQLIGGDA